MSGHMQPTQLHRRTSRGSASQAGCRSSRIEKTKSHHNSPKAMERRKTTSETKLYATLDDHYRMMFGVDPEEEERPQSTRPVSWHPASSQFQTSQQQQTNYFEPMPPQQWRQNYSPSRDSCHGSDYYSLSTRNSMLETRTSAFSSSEYGWQSTSQQNSGYVNSCMNTPTSEPLPWYLQQWAQKNQAQAFDSQDSAPVQQDQDMEDEEEGEKLVALGLYDAPEPSLTWGTLTEGTGKGLKLEETWQPPEEDEEDHDDDDASSEASVEEPSPPLPVVHEPVQHMPVHVKSQTPNSMEGQSFFFDDDESVSKEWWFQQVKQPSMQARDAALGYTGWL
ncbi:uncharacterized protein yc1106_09364 [Curvularia clavata]|uniref:Uncharacterized protein n=1 Tax=Curvularia clavata TaxID=95742 RepID=A0A9Q9DXL8_CURCL|nr:uncharacterized protein yc1106_09364 [Curvularia clavata]